MIGRNDNTPNKRQSSDFPNFSDPLSKPPKRTEITNLPSPAAADAAENDREPAGPRRRRPHAGRWRRRRREDPPVGEQCGASGRIVLREEPILRRVAEATLDLEVVRQRRRAAVLAAEAPPPAAVVPPPIRRLLLAPPGCVGGGGGG
ncbi:hypothetical protein ACLOJK_023715 [Asimina triloba]